MATLIGPIEKSLTVLFQPAFQILVLVVQENTYFILPPVD